VLELGAEGVPQLTTAREASPDWGEAQAVATARLLGELGDRSAVPALRAATADPRAAVREAASAALLTLEREGERP
jgi:HEAT repeat protein